MIKLLLTIIFLVSSLAGGLYVVYPQYESYQRQVKENEVLYEELENIVVYVAELKETEKEIGKHEEEFIRIKKALPEDHDAPSLFLYLKERMEENNLDPERSFGDFSVGNYKYNGTEHSRIKQTTFGLNIGGDYEDVKSFFKKTERLMRMITINSINIVGEGVRIDPFGRTGSAGRKEVIINVEGKTYSY